MLMHPVGAEQAHQIVLQAQIEPALAGVALTAGTAAQLIVDPPGLVALGADDEQAAGGTDLLRLLRDVGLVLFQQFLVGAGELSEFPGRSVSA